MTRVEFDTEINNLLNSSEELIPDENLPLLPFMELASDVHDWYAFELQLWDTGEKIRQAILNEHKEMNREQSNRVLNICLNKNAKRGRQSFVMLLGKKRFSPYAEKISVLLSDDDVDGHVISTLYKMGTTDYEEKIKPFLNHNRSWIRNEAKRYINRCDNLNKQ